MAPLSRLRAQGTALLHTAERYTKIDLTYVLKGGWWLTAEQVLFGLIALGVSVAFARFVPADTYGTYRFLLSLYWILTSFTLTGIPTAMSRAVARGEEGAYRKSFRNALLGAVPMSLLAFAVSFYYALHGSELAWGALAIGIIGPFFQAGYLYAPFLEGKGNFRDTAIFGFILNAVPAISLLISILFVRNPVIFLLVYLVGTTLTGLALCVITYVRYRPNNVQSPGLASLGGHLSAMNVLVTIANQVDQLLVFHFVGAAPLAVYSFATTFPDQIKAMFNNIANVAFPKFVRRPFGELRRTLGKRVLLLTLIAVVLTAAYIAAAPLLFAIFFPAYKSAIIYSQLYAISLIAVGTAIPVTVLQAHATKKALYVYNVSSGIFQVFTLVIGAAWFGIIGVIVARIISRLLNLGLSFFLVHRVAETAPPA